MRQTILVILYCFINLFAASGSNTDITIDSLLHLLPNQKEAEERYDIYRNIADISFETPQERTYLKLMYKEAEKSSNKKHLLEALGELASASLKANLTDSASYYIGQIEKMNPDTDTKIWLTYLHMRQFGYRISQGDNVEAFNNELKKHSSRKNTQLDIYSEIENTYSISSALVSLDRNKEALPYLKTAAKLTESLPDKEGHHIKRLVTGLLSSVLSRLGKLEKSVVLNEKNIELYNTYYNLIKKKRPIYNINTFYIQCYTSILSNMRGINPEKVPIYLQKIISLSEGSNNAFDKYNCFLALNNYYLQCNDCSKALEANDSLIKYATTIAPDNIPSLYNINLQIYSVMGDYKKAFMALQKAYSLNDSINTQKSREQLSRLQVEYGVDKLNYEKSQLELKNKRSLLIYLSILLFISIVISIYLYKSLKKERVMKATFRILKNKAEESENMKTAFVNSICHEIRTPLNSIVGFSDLIFDKSIDEELRKSFPEEIQKNTRQLTTLINSMLEVSNLNVSVEKLPCEPTDIKAICHQEMGHFIEYIKPEITTRLDMPEEDIIISCNRQYLALVLEHLLNNSNKFTESGEITLHACINKDQSKLQIRVTDTGCGIPPEKRDEVFERFTKLDTYKPGNGLGLYLCQLIIKRLSGEISIDPAYTKGTSIVIILPVD